MSYAVKEVFLTLQGEGANTGRAAVFCRFSRCNLWSGRESLRASSGCRFCDTDFVGTDGPGGGVFTDAASLADRIDACWPPSGPQQGRSQAAKFVVCTGGEPLLQLDDDLISALHDLGFAIAVETNGTLPVPAGVDWVCVSPKAGTDLVVTTGDELKLVYPQHGIGGDPATYRSLAFDHFFLQPMDGPDRELNTGLAVRYCLTNPGWRLSLQTHKLIGIP